MTINIARFYKRERLELDCKIITPMFLGNASQEAELRAAPFKGLLRYWWRVANGGLHETPGALLAAENQIFGSADADTGGKSHVTVEVKGDLCCYPENGFPKGEYITHPEVRNRNGKPMNIDRFLYLGYGPIAGHGSLKKETEGKGAFVTGQSFCLSLTATSEIMQQLQTTLQCCRQFGAVGGRSRNGWGCFLLTGAQPTSISDQVLFQTLGKFWEDCFTHDYPHRLGLSGHNLLLWRCYENHDDWEGAMNALAEIYMRIRMGHKFRGGGPHRNLQERHILGYPSGRKHQVDSWGNGRHGSALRLLVRKEAENYRGYILHLPHLFSEKMWPNEKERQIKIWQSVHANLDTLCERASYKETDQ